MKYLRTTILAITLLSSFANAQNKIPHSHHSAHGGVVLMTGDDHIEVVRSTNNKQLLVFLSDKMREPMNPSDFNYEVSLKTGDKVTPLKMIANTKSPFELSTLFPTADGNSEIVVVATRKVAPKGYVTTKRPEKVLLSKVPTMKPMDHSSHHGH